MNKWILALIIGVLAMTTLGQARTSGDADLAVQYASTGWVEDAESRTWSYSSADAPTYVFSVNDDMTTILSAGMRVRFKQSAGTYKYAIITAVGSYGSGVTLITVYCGTDYDLDNEAVSDVAYSAAKSPFGFPMNPDKWTVTKTNTSNVSQASPVANTWYNIDSISVPVGVWNIGYSVYGLTFITPSGISDFSVTLSTANNSQSDTKNTSYLYGYTTAGLSIAATFNKYVVLDLSTKTTYYLNYRTTVSSALNIDANGTVFPTIIRAVCAYL